MVCVVKLVKHHSTLRSARRHIEAYCEAEKDDIYIFRRDWRTQFRELRHEFTLFTRGEMLEHRSDRIVGYCRYEKKTKAKEDVFRKFLTANKISPVFQRMSGNKLVVGTKDATYIVRLEKHEKP